MLLASEHDTIKFHASDSKRIFYKLSSDFLLLGA